MSQHYPALKEGETPCQHPACGFRPPHREHGDPYGTVEKRPGGLAWTPIQERLLRAAQELVTEMEASEGLLDAEDEAFVNLRKVVQEISDQAVEEINRIRAEGQPKL